jgi:hypothetical protein
MFCWTQFMMHVRNSVPGQVSQIIWSPLLITCEQQC